MSFQRSNPINCKLKKTKKNLPVPYDQASICSYADRNCFFNNVMWIVKKKYIHVSCDFYWLFNCWFLYCFSEVQICNKKFWTWIFSSKSCEIESWLVWLLGLKIWVWGFWHDLAVWTQIIAKFNFTGLYINITINDMDHTCSAWGLWVMRWLRVLLGLGLISFME